MNRVRLKRVRHFIQQGENNFIQPGRLRTPFAAIDVRVRQRERCRLAEFGMHLEQRFEPSAKRLVAEAVEFRDEPDAVAPRGGGQRVRGFGADEIFLAQLWVRTKFKTVVHLNDHRVRACRRERGQRADEFLCARIAVHPQMHATPRAGNLHRRQFGFRPRRAARQQRASKERERDFFAGKHSLHAASLPVEIGGATFLK